MIKCLMYPGDACVYRAFLGASVLRTLVVTLDLRDRTTSAAWSMSAAYRPS